MAPTDPRDAVRHAIAYEHRLFLEVQNHEQEAARWQSRAQLALRRGEEALAREALARQTAAEGRAAEYRAQYLAQTQAVRQSKQALRRVPAAPPREPSPEERLNQLAREDRLDRDLAALKAQLQAG